MTTDEESGELEHASPKVVSRFDWERTLLHLDLPTTTLAVALIVATYSDGKTGQRIYPGEERLAADSNLCVRTVRRHMALLRETGLLVRVRRGRANQYGRTADEYALAMPSDVAERVRIKLEHPAVQYPGRFRAE